ncbi:hypothetical protein ARMGADRAFT_1082601 [Armillaria gallica]|uniref:Zn(2)-C6 fungal-type domain-containing protein n=1 Tax=Armillaria gallica TaxID=47427 RepID=A0A2H3D6I6_ARMGA|nr:hypothetical protein ARMGADRAFT_1082601 [Armillaria gallica]
MAEPPVVKDAAALKHNALSAYEAAVALLQHKVDFPPDVDSTSKDADEWIADLYVQWLICSNFWREAGVKRQDWNDVEYALLACLPSVDKGLLDESCGKFNELVHCAHKYLIPNLCPVPLDTPSPSLEPESHVQAPVLLRTIAPLLALKPTTPPSPKEKMPALRQQQSMVPVTPQRTRKVTPNPSDSSEAFQKDWTSPLHSKPAQQLKIGPPVNAMQSEVLTRASSRALAIDAAARTNIIHGPDPNLGPLREGNVVIPLSDRQLLFFLGTDDEEERIQEDLVTSRAAFFEDDGLADNISNLDDDEPVPPQDEPMGFDKDEPSSDDEEPSPPPTNLAHCLHQEPRISFVFDEVTEDFVKSHPTIFLPRPAVSPASSQDLRHSAHSCGSPVNPDATYLKAIQGSKVDVKKKNKDAKGKDWATEAKVPRKCVRTEDNATQLKDKLASKKPKLKETIIIDEDESAVATKVICRHGPGLSRPLPVTLGVSGGGFGEKVPSSANVVKNRIKSIGILVVDRDFGNFIEVDKSYWSKEVAPFVGEQHTTACDHCRHLGTQCRKLLMHTVKCVRCHYSKLPCKVNGVAVLNPVKHYRPKGYDAVNTFEGTLNAIETNNATISELTQQYLAGLSIFMHMDSIQAQASHLCGCLYPIEDEDEEDGEEDDDGEAPEDVAEGVTGPSKQKKKGKSG